jgi:hypothetical protein
MVLSEKPATFGAGIPIPKLATLAASSGANFGIEGHQQLYDSSAAF